MVFNRDKKKESIFRQESLERLSSPERLDTLMHVISSKDWVALIVLGSLLVGGTIWSIVARIPITVEGRGIFIQPRQIVDFQSSIGGQIKILNVKNEQCVKKDDIIATIEPAELNKQLQLAREKLTQIKAQVQDASLLSQQRIQIEKNTINNNRISLEQRLNDTRTLAPMLRDKEISAISQQRQSLQQRLNDANTLVPVMQSRFQQRQKLANEGVLSKDTLLQAEQEYVQARQTVADIQAQLKQLEAQNSNIERQYLEQMRSMSDIQVQLGELNTRAKRIDQESVETTNQRTREIQEVTREIERLEQQIKQNSQILSPQDGCILELTATPGQVVQPGMKLGTFRVGKDEEPTIGIAYFSIKEGKKIKPKMPIFVTPDTVQRERFGGIVGEITNVSSLPVTKEGALSVIGHPELVRNLIGETGAAIEITANLKTDPNTISGYKWSSSKGPESKITPGTTATVRVTIEQRSPITFVLPFLRELAGMK